MDDIKRVSRRRSVRESGRLAKTPSLDRTSRGVVRPPGRMMYERGSVITQMTTSQQKHTHHIQPSNQNVSPAVNATTQQQLKQTQKPVATRRTVAIKKSPSRTQRYLVRSVKKAELLDKIVATKQTKAKNRRTGLKQRTSTALQKVKNNQKISRAFNYLYVVSAVVLLVFVSYAVTDTLATNAQVKEEFSQASPSDDEASKNEARIVREGKDETPKDENTLKNYKVAPDLPRAIYIPKINVQARILPMGVNQNGSMQAPINIFDAGWFTGSVKPGETGAVVVDAHASGPTREGLFAYLDDLKNGDTIEIEKGDGTKISYRVVHTQTKELDEVDMKKVMLPYENTTKGLNLITCTGSYVKNDKTFSHRHIVYTEQIE